MKIVAMIPARYAASRFPAKLMQDLNGAPVIVRTLEATMNTDLFDKVYVVTDSDLIEKVVTEAGGTVIKSTQEYECGSDRIAAAAQTIEADIIINVQGDEPFIEKESLKSLIDVFKEDSAKEIDLASLMHPLKDQDSIENPNNVKVIVDQQSNALYFSRAPIPYLRDQDQSITYYKHKGIYAFRKEALLEFPQLQMGPLEAAEKIEAIRYLEYGKKIKMVHTDQDGIGIDTLEDLVKARNNWK
ncbi:MAG: 3-deoxy-manno-octulosonate cytidylyltransferase [Flavobacteriaceae bacterium]|jgi:3-deoxy-manno-octulosonate cytidylyltransferase (CMP-KDO synthetase)|nr:3-deoxy-manno-octulosonate cytidylyltransferase [Flavobacteriaceae bacterium]